MTFQTRGDINRFTSKLYKFLDDSHTVQFRRMKTNRGLITTIKYPTQLQLDYTDNIIPTLIHEVLHYLYPDASEEWILKMETRITNKLSERQVRNIIRRLAQNI